MSNYVTNQKKELLYLKIKSIRESNKPLVKRSLEYPYLNNYNKISSIMKNAISNLEKTINIEENNIIIIINHPVLSDIYIYSKDQWLLYYNYNIIEQCINNNILKIKYDLYDNNDSLKNMGKNKKKVIKHIIQNISMKLFSKIFFNFLKENGEISKKFKNYFIAELLKEKPEKNKEKKTSKDLDFNDLNLNINKKINNEETEESSTDLNENKKVKKEIKLDRDYFLHTVDFLKTLEEQFKSFSEKQENLNRIKELIGEESDDYKIDNNNIQMKTSLKINLEDSLSFSNLSLFVEDNTNNNNNKENNVLLTQLTPPPGYFKKLLSDDNCFKSINKQEYYIGIEEFKDNINRQFLKNSKLFE